MISEGHKCVNCGQCIQVCPTGALMQYEDTPEIEKKLTDPDTFCISTDCTGSTCIHW